MHFTTERPTPTGAAPTGAAPSGAFPSGPVPSGAVPSEFPGEGEGQGPSESGAPPQSSGGFFDWFS